MTTVTAMITAKKELDLNWQNNNFACASRLFVYFLAIATRLRRENA